MIRVGTSYFKSVAAACGYYKPYEPGTTPHELRAIVERKIAEGLIHIGKPPLEPGDVLELIDGGTRYAITSTTSA